MEKMAAFEKIQKHYRQRDLAAREWKNKGGKVVGYFCNNVPEEIILAAGFFPLRISGDPGSGKEKAEKYNLVRGASEDFTLSMLNLILTGDYDFLDFLIVPHARDSIHGLYAILSGIKASDAGSKLPELYFLDNLHTTFFLSQAYNRDMVLDLKYKLEEWSGKPISESPLSEAINVVNENKVLLNKVAGLRSADPPRISGTEALQIIGSSMLMLKEEHNTLLKQFLDEADTLPPRKGARLFVEGSPLDHLQLYEIIEASKAVVIAENHCWGNRSFAETVDTSINPFDAIVDRYHRKPPCPRIHPLSKRVAYCVESAVNARAQGAIFNIMENDDQAWDITDDIKALDEVHIPSLYLKNQPYSITDPESLKARIDQFVASLTGN